MRERTASEIKEYAVGIIIPLAVGGVSALFSYEGMAGFENLNQPAFSPPFFVFPVAWTILYILMGIGSVMVKREGGEASKKALYIYGIQLAVNFMWSIFFFRDGLFLFSFFWLVFLWVLVFIMTIRFLTVNPTAGYLQFPYLLWLTFAAYLNLSVYFLNR